MYLLLICTDTADEIVIQIITWNYKLLQIKLRCVDDSIIEMLFYFIRTNKVEGKQVVVVIAPT